MLIAREQAIVVISMCMLYAMLPTQARLAPPRCLRHYPASVSAEPLSRGEMPPTFSCVWEVIEATRTEDAHAT